MNRHLIFWAVLVMAPFMFTSMAKADAGRFVQVEAGVTSSQSSQSLQPCPMPKGVHVAETSQADCCKGRKGICGCRAGKLICCDGTASTQPGCTCHGEDGFLE